MERIGVTRRPRSGTNAQGGAEGPKESPATRPGFGSPPARELRSGVALVALNGHHRHEI